ncbi:MAG: type III secretion system chaperone [Victivallales bacterium]|nr:type III secretion system chaperone [Victivallales bacterium]
MTDKMQMLASMAAELVPPDSLEENDDGFTLKLEDGLLSFFSSGGYASMDYCRAKVADLGEGELPEGLCEALLEGNFFWRATNGARISLNSRENAIYLTERFDADFISTTDEFRRYVEGFMRTIQGWRMRVETFQDAKEARQ